MELTLVQGLQALLSVTRSPDRAEIAPVQHLAVKNYQTASTIIHANISAQAARLSQ